ncbi:cyclic AMP-dependent transcription factor ATF-3-like [Gigantopelta aegis]|uniref:cyclic AMP-dependent transcription factor ATF-3-like n=1 Tax=Gigantopelta aegis TaxID=1735272 RepID=UPI001B88C2A5|nr:cyclic AMP-dependent transcription factor ATF-3-like [Gigantopelta aegis]
MLERQNSTECRMVAEDYTRMETSVRPTVSSSGDILANFATPSMTEFTPDKHVVAATLAALEEHGSLTPLIKDELKTKIQTRRCLEGQEELKIEFNKPKPKTLTGEEARRALSRREQNRKAAQRFRSRQKETAHRLLKKTERLESKNTTLRTCLADLKKEMAELEALWLNHLLVYHSQQTTDG